VDIQAVVDAGAEIGEGPLWDADLRRLLWVDIPTGLITSMTRPSARIT